MMIPLTPWSPTAPTALSAINPPSIAMATNANATSSAAKYARYVHQLFCSPLAAKLLQALTTSTKLTTIPGLTPALIWSHLPSSMATGKGRMRCHHSRTALTDNNHADIVQAQAKVNQMCPPHKACMVQDMFCFAALADATLGMMYTNITGAFAIWSFKNMQYIFVAYIYNLNAIIVRPMPPRTNSLFIAAFSKVFRILRACNYQPALNFMDNRCSKVVEKHIRANEMDIQLVPPHNHRINATERAITTFKEHFVAPLATVDMLYPLQLWDKFLPQVELTLNLFQFSCCNLRVLANQELYGPFDFNKMPLAPLKKKHWFTTILQQEPPRCRTQLTVSTLAWPTTTTIVFVSTSRQLGVSLCGHVAAGPCILPSPCFI
jgi:hypothetical protein